MSEVTLQGVSKVFDRTVAVNNISLQINHGEFMVIVGPSGCGKTTTLRMIAGLEDISSGTIRIGDRIVNDIPPKDRDIAMVFQNYALYPHMTVFDNMAFGLKLRKYPKQKIKSLVEETARMLGIEAYLSRKPKALSGGQRQRVALGRAIVRSPKVFLFDEPLSNLDAKLRVTTRSELKALQHKLQTTSIYVTHDQAEAMTLGDRICVMHNGNIRQIAPPMEVYDRPADRFVAGFLGTPPMNFFDGIVVFEKDRPFFKVDDTSLALRPALKNELAAYKDQPMVLGIRPESLTPKPDGYSEHSSLDAVVKVIEPLGDRMDVYFETASQRRVIANIDPHIQVEIGQRLPLHLNLEKAHVFERGETGRNVCLS
ncbi:MAG: sn-glycerol-3-phosphate ABC transporter ATP-binding protein UgpC [Planctomycetaceae bacterium]|nr:sn-glycerol-3-phosphate ABC transporter ATP-binding protein UgpC [Planctomycetaceae bacterium]